MPGFGGAEQIEEGSIIGVFVKDSGTTIASVQHVIGVTSTVAARNARHGSSTVRQMGIGVQEKVACPLFDSLSGLQQGQYVQIIPQRLQDPVASMITPEVDNSGRVKRSKKVDPQANYPSECQ